MVSGDTQNSNKPVLSETEENSIVFDAIGNASELYERYREISNIAEIAALNQYLVNSVDRQYSSPAPLGLVIWNPMERK